MEYGAVVVWWLALLVIAVAGLPIAATVFRALPDRGASLALPAALVVLFLPVFWLGHLQYGPGVVALGAVVLAAISVLAGRRGPEIDRLRFAESAAVFTLAFALVVAVRAVDPSILPAGGEKFLDYGLLRALASADRLPPADPWFAGEPVAYYYGGQLLASTVATLTGTATRYAYNLALAGVYGTLVAGVYGLAGSIAADRGKSYRWAGALAAFFVGLASNVVPALQAVLWALPAATAGSVAEAVADRTRLPAEALVSPEAFSYWTASRVIPGTINEFPFFAYLNGDLHAHMSSTPFLLLVAGICFAYYRTSAESIRRRRLLVYGTIPPVAGTAAVVNTWSLPATAGLAALAVLFADAPARDLLPRAVADRLPATRASGSGAAGTEVSELGAAGTEANQSESGVEGALVDEAVRIGTGALAALTVLVLALLWVLPYVGVLTAGPDTRTIGVLPERSSLLAFVLVHGWFLGIYGAYLLSRADALGRYRWPAAGVAALVLVGGLLLGAMSVAIALLLLALAWYLLRRADVGFEAVLLVAGAGLVAIVEVLYLDEPSGPDRLNTVFKTYAQVWLLWGLGAGVALADLVPGPPRLDSARGGAAAGLTAVLLLSGSFYGVAALDAHFGDAPEPTLDATTWAQTAHADEWGAIEYLDRQPGRPTIVSAPGCYCHGVESVTPYSWANAPSTFSGAATVAGWDHADDYHGEEPYRQRVDDVEAIYTGDADTRDRLLARYEVEYVYVGPHERTLYGDVDLSREAGLEVVYGGQGEAVTIYAVNGSAS